ncbi:MAG: beta-lactamase family protein [Solirubrobacterales bacterium]|nr:beta-lactamase family protein [Solirubrobacterales bacterium]
MIARLSRDIPALMAENREVGLSIALVDGQRVVWARGFGYADLAARKRVTADTLFHIGSVAKTLTAAAVMQLVERGLVDLDAPLSRYVPGFSLLPRFRGNVISVRSVLDHHAGIPGTLTKGFITTGRPDPGYPAWMLKALRSMYPTQRVNTIAGYDNSGYVLLQMLVEHVSGLSFEAYARRYLFRPMGMASSSFDDRRVPAARLTHDYQATFSPDGKATGLVAEPREFVNAWGAGSAISSARDMAGYLKMLVAGGRATGGRVLKSGALRAMWTAQRTSPLDRWNCCSGLGWSLSNPALNWAGPVRFKGGDTLWAHAYVMVLPRSGLGVAVLTNTTTGEVRGPVAFEALRLAYTAKVGRPQPPTTPLPASVPTSVPASVLRTYAGYYATNSGLDRVEVDSRGAGLVWTRNAGIRSQSTATYAPYRDGWFRTTTAGMPQIAFRNVQGRRLMLTREIFAPALLTTISGQRVPKNRVPAAWSSRLGRYRALHIRTIDAIVARSVRLIDTDGVLVLALGAGLDPFEIEADRQVLQPASGSVAFTFGLGTTLPAFDKGDSVTAFRTADGRDGFTYLGVRYLRTGSRP